MPYYNDILMMHLRLGRWQQPYIPRTGRAPLRDPRLMPQMLNRW